MLEVNWLIYINISYSIFLFNSLKNAMLMN
jgi:hypothetical protein